MKRVSVIIIVFLSSLAPLISCNQESGNKKLQHKIDSLQAEIVKAYVPGTGEIMSNIVQPHHYKLWLAGENKNWELAKYESHLLAGGFKRIQKYHRGTTEATAVPMIYPQLDAIDLAIRQHDQKQFDSSFVLLTGACNTCHQATNYGFNVITVPGVKSGFENQKF
jgi:hypothetical protein